MVVDLGTQLGLVRSFAVWDSSVQRFWKINNHQAWHSLAELVADFRAKDRPEPRFRDAYKEQEEAITVKVVLAGFDTEESEVPHASH